VAVPANDEAVLDEAGRGVPVGVRQRDGALAEHASQQPAATLAEAALEARLPPAYWDRRCARA
jgi:hypothetical protein